MSGIQNSVTTADLQDAVEKAARAVPPVWPLASSVAVNPYLGQTGLGLAETGALLARVAGARVTMPRSWYREKIAAGQVCDEDLAAALLRAPAQMRPKSVDALKQAAGRESPAPVALPTIADLCARASGI